MQRLSSITLLMAGFFLLGLAIFWPVPAHAADPSQLTIADVTWRPATVFPGDQLTLSVTLANPEEDALAVGDSALTLQIVLLTRDRDQQQTASQDQPLTGLDGLLPGASKVVTTSLIAPGVGDYNVVARLLVDGQTTGVEREKRLVVESALPPGVTQIFAGLGMFIAVITIMALGTEIVIDSLKFFIGLKRKVTALEAYDKLAKDLPGELKALGVDAAAIEQFKQLTRDLRQTLKPIEDATKMYAQIQQGLFGEAYDTLNALAPQVGKVTDKELTELKNNARSALDKAFLALRQQLNLSPAQTAAMEEYLRGQIDRVTPQTATTLADDAFKAIQAWSPELTESWLNNQIDTIMTIGRDQLNTLIDDNVLPVLTGLGFDQDVTRQRLMTAADQLEKAGRGQALAYVASLQNLLKAVEVRRNAMQSPLRKSYRRLRQSTLSFWAVFVGLLVFVGAWWAQARFLWPAIAGAAVAEFLATIALGTLLAVLTGLIMRGMNGGLQLGQVLRWLEANYNRILGRADQPVLLYGEPEVSVIVQIERITPTTAAQILMEREDKHRDEEASRLRALRIIALFVGVVLAYLLQIDAAVLLDEAVPGVSKSINSILDLSAAQLQAIWPRFPDNLRLTAGIILTGLAASAGSAFWHEQLGRLQGAKDQAEAAAKLLRRARDLPEGE